MSQFFLGNPTDLFRRLASQQFVNHLSPGRIRGQSVDRGCKTSQNHKSKRRGKLREVIEKYGLSYPRIALNKDRAPVMALKGILKLATFVLSADHFAAAMVVMHFRNGHWAICPHQRVASLDALRGKNRETDAVVNCLRGRSVAEDTPSRQIHQARSHVDGGAHKAVFAALVAAIVRAK